MAKQQRKKTGKKKSGKSAPARPARLALDAAAPRGFAAHDAAESVSPNPFPDATSIGRVARTADDRLEALVNTANRWGFLDIVSMERTSAGWKVVVAG